MNNSNEFSEINKVKTMKVGLLSYCLIFLNAVQLIMKGATKR